MALNDVKDREPVVIPDRGRRYFDPSVLGTLEVAEEGAQSVVFQKLDDVTDKVITEGIGTFLKIPALTNTTLMMPIGLVDPNPHQPRNLFDREKLDELATSITTNGQIMSCSVVPYRNLDGKIRFALVDGERRWQALCNLKATHVAVEISWTPDNGALFTSSAISNLNREGHTDWEEAVIFLKLLIEARRRGIKKEADRLQSVVEQTGKTLQHIKRLLRLLKLDPAVQQLVHRGAIRTAQAFMIETVAKDKNVSQAQLAFRALGMESASDTDRISGFRAWGRINEAKLQEAADMMIQGEQGEVDPVRARIRKQVSEVIEAMERVKLSAGRLLDSREQHPDLTDDVLSNSRFPIPKLRERLDEVIGCLSELKGVAEKLDNPILTAPEIKEKPSLASFVKSKETEITTCERERDKDPALRRFWIMCALAETGDARTQMPTAFELVDLLNNQYHPNPGFNPSAIGSALSQIPEVAEKMGLSLDRAERRMRNPDGNFRNFTCYRLLWKEQQEIVDKIRTEAEAKKEKVCHQVKAEPVKKIELNRPMVQAILNHLSGELLEALGIRKTQYAITFMTYLLWKGEGVESNFAEFCEFVGAENTAERVKTDRDFTFARKDFQQAGIIDSTPNNFKLVVGKLLQLDAEQIRGILEKTALEMGENASLDAAITPEVLTEHLKFLQDLPLMEACAKLRAGGIEPTTSVDAPAPPSELSPIADATPPPTVPPTTESTIVVAAIQTASLPPTPMPEVPDTSTPVPSPTPAADVAPTSSPKSIPHPLSPTATPRTPVSRPATPVEEPRQPIQPRTPATVSAQAQQVSGVTARMPQAPQLMGKRSSGIRSPREMSPWMGSSEILRNSLQDKLDTIRKNYEASSQGLDENATYEIKSGIKGYDGLRGEHLKILPLRRDTEDAYLAFDTLPEGHTLVTDKRKKIYRVHKDDLVLISSATQPSQPVPPTSPREPGRQRQGNALRGNPRKKTNYPIPKETGTACELKPEAREKRKGGDDPLIRPFIVINPNDSEAQNLLSRFKGDMLKKTIEGIKNGELVIVRANRDQKTLHMIVNHGDIRQSTR